MRLKKAQCGVVVCRRGPELLCDKHAPLLSPFLSQMMGLCRSEQPRRRVCQTRQEERGPEGHGGAREEWEHPKEDVWKDQNLPFRPT